MGIEIEHKYLVKDNSYKESATSKHLIIQGYLSRIPERTVRIRIFDEKGFITVKGKNQGEIRLEFEYEIPLEDATSLLRLCLPPIIEKYRYNVPYGGFVWEIDEFLGERAGLVVGEIELPDKETQYP
ncbi:MAG: CYTH domain-containing protein, partial [Muribaculaceae bacterium]|nr:CYTH domain-containing protein [Muribaculaceae bacterium]